MLIYSLTGLDKVGGYNKLETLYMEAIPTIRDNNSTCGFPPSDAFHVLRDPVTSDQPWPGLILQASLGCLWYWCCDQVLLFYTLSNIFLSIKSSIFLKFKAKNTVSESTVCANKQTSFLSDCLIRDYLFAFLAFTWVRVVRINPEFRKLRLTFHRKSASKC